MRNFTIASDGHAELQKGPLSDDLASSWDDLRFNISEVLKLGLHGVPINTCSNDSFAHSVGRNIRGNYELMTRWMQLGAFLPWCCSGYRNQFIEAYGFDEPVPGNCRKYFRLRSRLNQLYLDAAYQRDLTGMPVLRALFLNDPDDPAVYAHLEDQFTIGRDFLVAPVLTRHETANLPTRPFRDVYLPRGCKWYPFEEDGILRPVEGGRLYRSVLADLSQMPIFVRDGAILPFRPGIAREDGTSPLCIQIYPGQDRNYQMCLKNPYGRDFRLLEIRHRSSGPGREVRIRRIVDERTPPEKFFYLALKGSSSNCVRICGVEIEAAANALEMDLAPGHAWYRSESDQTTFVKLKDDSAEISVLASRF